MTKRFYFAASLFAVVTVAESGAQPLLHRRVCSLGTVRTCHEVRLTSSVPEPGVARFDLLIRGLDVRPPAGSAEWAGAYFFSGNWNQPYYVSPRTNWQDGYADVASQVTPTLVGNVGLVEAHPDYRDRTPTWWVRTTPDGFGLMGAEGPGAGLAFGISGCALPIDRGRYVQPVFSTCLEDGTDGFVRFTFDSPYTRDLASLRTLLVISDGAGETGSFSNPVCDAMQVGVWTGDGAYNHTRCEVTDLGSIGINEPPPNPFLGQGPFPPAPVPEPSSLSLLALGGGLFSVARRWMLKKEAKELTTAAA